MAKRMEDGGGGGRPMIPSSSWSCPRLVGDGKTTHGGVARGKV